MVNTPHLTTFPNFSKILYKSVLVREKGRLEIYTVLELGAREEPFPPLLGTAVAIYITQVVRSSPSDYSVDHLLLCGVVYIIAAWGDQILNYVQFSCQRVLVLPCLRVQPMYAE